jgi:predicted acyltransferase (DUF342 family)
MDRDIQRRLREAEESGDPERIQQEQQFAKENYNMGTGAIVGNIVGNIICPGLGGLIGGLLGGYVGHESSK